MSLLKWKELAKQKSELGNKINFVHDKITNKKLGEETSQLGYEKIFNPITKLLKEKPKKEEKPKEDKEDLYEGLEDYLRERDFYEGIEDLFEEREESEDLYEGLKDFSKEKEEKIPENLYRYLKFSETLEDYLKEDEEEDLYEGLEDYLKEKGEEIPEDFGEEVYPQSEKQLPDNPPRYEDLTPRKLNLSPKKTSYLSAENIDIEKTNKILDSYNLPINVNKNEEDMKKGIGDYSTVIQNISDSKKNNK